MYRSFLLKDLAKKCTELNPEYVPDALLRIKVTEPTKIEVSKKPEGWGEKPTESEIIGTVVVNVKPKGTNIEGDYEIDTVPEHHDYIDNVGKVLLSVFLATMIQFENFGLKL
jgi:hypothetical protein